jgi:hypothetical protein
MEAGLFFAVTEDGRGVCWKSGMDAGLFFAVTEDG